MQCCELPCRRLRKKCTRNAAAGGRGASATENLEGLGRSHTPTADGWPCCNTADPRGLSCTTRSALQSAALTLVPVLQPSDTGSGPVVGSLNQLHSAAALSTGCTLVTGSLNFLPLLRVRTGPQLYRICSQIHAEHGCSLKSRCCSEKDQPQCCTGRCRTCKPVKVLCWR